MSITDITDSLSKLTAFLMKADIPSLMMAEIWNLAKEIHSNVHNTFAEYNPRGSHNPENLSYHNTNNSYMYRIEITQNGHVYYFIKQNYINRDTYTIFYNFDEQYDTHYIEYEINYAKVFQYQNYPNP